MPSAAAPDAAPPDASTPLAEASGSVGPLVKKHLAYGPNPLHFGDLRVPPGKAPRPVAVVIHGGCWLNSYGLDLMDAMSQSLAEAGLATWNIEYRRIGDPGGGYPATLTDVGAAIDALRTMAPTYGLDLTKVITVGHSAGGHLAVWAAARPKLPVTSPLRGADPLSIAAAVALAGVLDLSESIDIGVCGGAAAKLMGGAPHKGPDSYDEASPRALLPIGVRQRLIHGSADAIVPFAMSEHYKAAALSAGEPVIDIVPLRGGSHFDVIETSTSKWRDVQAAILEVVP